MNVRWEETTVASPRPSTLSILVVDDTEDSRTITSTILRLKGFKVEEASTGQEALERAAGQPDLIVLDVTLPDIDGFAVCRRLKGDPATATIPVLHLSAHRRSTNDRVRGMDDGADAYLVQPADPDELVATVKALLRRAAMKESEADRSRRKAAEEAALALVEVGHELTAAGDVSQATQRAVETVCRVFRVRRSAIYELDRASSTLICMASAGDAEAGRWLEDPAAVAEGSAGLAVIEGRAVACADLLNDDRMTLTPETRARMQSEPCRAVASVPLVAPGDVLGAWSMVDRAGRVFTEEELRLLSAFADQVALAVQNARLSEDLERRLERSHGLLRVAQLLNTSLEPSEIARRASREVTHLLGADTSVFFAVDHDRGDAVGVAGYHVPPAVWHADYRVALANLPAFFREAASTGRPIASDDVASDRRLDHPAIRMMPTAPRSLLCVPVVRNGRVNGALLTYWWSTSHRVTDEETRLASSVANQLVLALVNADLHTAEARRREEAEARLARMRSLAALSQLMMSSLDVQRVLDFVTDAVLELLNADLARLWIVDEAARETRLMAEKPPRTTEPSPRERLPFAAGVVGAVIEERKPFYCEDIRRESRLINRQWLTRNGYTSLIAVPLVIGDRAVGALAVFTKSARRFTDEDIELLVIFAGKAATALENARLYQKATRAYEELAQAQDQLLQSQKMEAVGQLAGGIAHDFNNLLTVIAGRAQLILRMLPPNQRLRRDVEIVAHTASRATALTQQLLAFSRRQILQPRVLDLNQVVTGISTMLERLIGEHIALHLDVSTEHCPVRANRGHVEQVITNLSVNARDAQPDGGALFITTRNVEVEEARPGGPRPGAYVMLAVRDAGSGMDATTQARIFEPFFTTKDKGKGTGLGLSTVYGIVTQSGGHIAVASRPGHGTTFEIYLPRAGDSIEPDVEPLLTEPTGGSETILVVEDDDEVRRLAAEILSEYGYRVLEAKNGEGALQIFEHHAGLIDLVVTDVVMPAMGGRELSHHVGRSGPATRVLFMSGYPGEMTIPPDSPDTGLFFLAKPFAPRALADKVRGALDSPKSPAKTK